MIKIKDHMKYLGMKVSDKVTGFTGVVTSVCFDLYGCVQCTVHPGLDKDKKPKDSQWFDVARLDIVGKTPVMKIPVFQYDEDIHGPAEKPSCQ